MSKLTESEGMKCDQFLLMAETLTKTKEKHLHQKEQFNDTLKEGYIAFDKGLYRRSIDCYKKALKIVTNTPLTDFSHLQHRFHKYCHVCLSFIDRTVKNRCDTCKICVEYGGNF